MQKASISQLQTTLHTYLAWVKAGEEVLVTEDGAPIAKIVPLPQPPVPWPASLAVLEQAGLVRTGTGRVPEAVWTHPRPQDPTGAGRHALGEDRERAR